MTPEEKARVKIDQMFEDAGWKVDDKSLADLMATIQQKSDNISKAVTKLQELLKGIEE